MLSRHTARTNVVSVEVGSTAARAAVCVVIAGDRSPHLQGHSADYNSIEISDTELWRFTNSSLGRLITIAAAALALIL